MKIQPIYYRKTEGVPFHIIHGAWVRSLKTEKAMPYIPEYCVDRPVFWHPILSQFLAIFQGLFISKADIYLAESMACVPATLFRKKKSKLIVINSDTFFNDLKRTTGLKKKYMLWLLKHVDGFISTSKMMKQMAEEYSSAPNEVVYPFIDDRFFKIEADLKSNDVCYFGRFAPEKNVKLLPFVQAYVKGSKLKVVGGELDGYFNKKHIQSYPWTKEPEKIASTCGTYINLSSIEPFGANIVEAMAMGMIPVVSKYCGAKDFVEQVDKELVIDIDVNQAAKVIDDLNNNQKKKEVLATLSRLAVADLTKEKSIASFQKAFEVLSK
jgi:glycosyltransferase involved in cell wall biosynthesis